MGYKGRPRGYCYMLTVTLKHTGKKGRRLKLMRQGIADAWRLFNQGRQAKALKSSMGLAHYVRSLEVTYGERHGWHPHLHNILFTTRKLDSAHELEIQERWQDCVRRALGSDFVPDLKHGAHLTEQFSDEYLTKLGLEIAAIEAKAGRRGNRSPWAIAADAVAGDRASQVLWQTYCRETRGARQLTWSRGTRRFFGIADLSDDELASDGVAVVEGVGHVLGEFEGSVWDRSAWRRGFVSSVIAAASSDTPITSLSARGAKAVSPPGRVFGEQMREPSSPRATCPSSSPPYNSVTAEYSQREIPPDQIASSVSLRAKR